MHQIHCLDAIRQEAYFDHYFGKLYPDRNPPEVHKLHLSHCIYYLLQNIMCTANTDIYTHVWTDTLPNPYPDFNINHKCRNFDKLLSWHDQHSVDESKFWILRKPEDHGPALNMKHKFKEIFGYFRTHEDDGSSGEELG